MQTTDLQRSGNDPATRPVERDETHHLISSDKVEGTKVYGTDGEKLGTVERLMIGKRSGQVEYAVMSFGGFLGLGEDHHPLPWDALDYDTERGGYVVNIHKSRLKDAPRFARDEEPEWTGDYGRNVYAYYGIPY